MLDSHWLFFVYYIGWETRCGWPPGAGHYLNIQKNAYTSQGVILQRKLIRSSSWKLSLSSMAPNSSMDKKSVLLESVSKSYIQIFTSCYLQLVLLFQYFLSLFFVPNQDFVFLKHVFELFP